MQKLLLASMVWVALLAMGSVAQAEERLVYDEATKRWRPADEMQVKFEGPLGEIQQLMQAGKYGKAESLATKYIKTNKESDEAEILPAMLLEADCAYLRGDTYKAYKRYQKIIDDFPDTQEYAISLKRQLDISKLWLDGKKRLLWGIFLIPAQDDALEALDRIEQTASGHRIAEVAVRMKADYYYKDGQFDLAETEYLRLVREFKSPKYSEPSLYRAASSALASFPGIAFDDTGLVDAAELYTEYLITYPDQAKKDEIAVILKDIASKRAEKEVLIGDFYARLHFPKSAELSYNYVMKTWPDTLSAETARAKLERMGFEPKYQTK